MGAPSSTVGVNNGPESGQEVPHVHVIPRFRGGIVQGVARGLLRPSGEEMRRIAERIGELSSSGGQGPS